MRNTMRDLAYLVMLWICVAIIVMSCLAVLQGCSVTKAAAQAMVPVEATFADPDSVMLRTVEPFEVNAEYYDRTAKAVRVKRWRVDPPAWIVNEAMLKARRAAK